MHPSNQTQSYPGIAPSDSQENFSVVYLAAAACLRKVHSPRNVSWEKLVRFGMDISLVACGIRLGYLFDAFAVRDRRTTIKEVLTECLSQLQRQKYLAHLRADNSKSLHAHISPQAVPTFRNVCLIQEQTSDQLFFVNVNCLLSRSFSLLRISSSATSRASEDAMSPTTFIRVEGSSAELCTPPPRLQSLLADLVYLVGIKSEQTVSLPEDDRTQDLGTMVAFAACILEFPVAYVPTVHGGGAFLAGVPLDVYECALEINTSPGIDLSHEHVMLKFSCPQVVARTQAELHPETTMNRLQALFEARLRNVAFPGRVIVRHSTETLDRVAL